ncbi:MAG TPA: hypothetical protein VJ249_06110 [Candidatus Bathyarchaeia archaeon]|nr:hypothetical protein [Candidatus Bathyarchaeia archaeon]
MKLKIADSRFFSFSLLLVLIIPIASDLLFVSENASPDSNYYFMFTVDRDGFTNVEINFNSTDTSGESWVFVPKYSSWNHTETSGQITQSELVETDQVIGQALYFYQAFRFRYQSTGVFNMTLKFDFNNGALVMEPDGMFYSPQIGFQASSNGNAEVTFDHNFQINEKLAVVVGSSTSYPVQKVVQNRALFRLQENVVRIQIEFSVNATPQEITLRNGDNKTFTFKTVSRYETYARNILRLYDRIYNQTARLFNVTLEDIIVQWFLPDFESLLSVGGYVPVFTGGLGEINLNIVFIRTVNGTIEAIATHELVHRFLGTAGIPPSDFLWFHEGMAQYISVNLVANLGYEGAETEKENLENGVSRLIQLLGGENFDSISLQRWSPSSQPSTDVSSLYVASYYVVSRLPQVVKQDGFEYYQRFFELVGQLPSNFSGVKVKNISEMTLYLSQAANASVASTLKRWGFSLTDLYESPIQELIAEAGKALGEVNPIFQPYRFLADYFYQQALSSAEQGDWDRASSLLNLSITLANLAPLLTFLTIIGILVLLVFILTRKSGRTQPVVPPPPPEIMQPRA